MATTFAFELDSKQNRNGLIPIYIRLTQNRRMKRIKTGVTIRRKADWNPRARNENWVRQSDPDHAVKNAALAKELASVKSTYSEQRDEGGVSLQKVATAYKTADLSPSFLDYVEKLATQQDETGHIRNAKTYRKFKNKVELFRPNVVFADIDIAFISDFEAFLATLPNQRHPDRRLAVNSIHTEMKTFRAIMRRAVVIDRIIKDTPFKDYTLKVEKTSKDKLTREEMDAIVALDLPKESLIRHARNAFLLSYYCAGVRVGDIIQLRWSNVSSDGRISYVMDKTDKVRDLVLTRQAKEIIAEYDGKHGKDDYIFPFLDNNAPWARYVTQAEKNTMPVEIMKQMYNKISSVNALLNKYLANIAKRAGIDKKVSFHVSRHSFAFQALQDEIDPMTIKGALAHGSLLTTETYLKDFDNSELDSTIQRMFDSKPDMKKLVKTLVSLSDKEYDRLLKTVEKQRTKAFGNQRRHKPNDSITK